MMFVWLMTGTGFAGGSIQVDSLAVDGLELRELSCELEKAPLLGPIVVAGALAKQKEALHACAPEGHAFRVTWTWAQDTKAVVAASSAPDKDACVTKAIAAVPAALPGTCRAVILTGPTEAAEVARAKLPTE